MTRAYGYRSITDTMKLKKEIHRYKNKYQHKCAKLFLISENTIDFFFQINTKDRVEKCVNFIKLKFMYNPIYLFFE